MSERGQFYKAAVTQNKRSHFMCTWTGWRRKCHFRWSLNDANMLYQAEKDSDYWQFGGLEAKAQQGCCHTAESLGEALSCLAQLPGLRATSCQAWPPWSRPHVLCMSVLRTLATWFSTPALDNPGRSSLLKILSLIISERAPFPSKVTLTGSQDENTDIHFRGTTITAPKKQLKWRDCETGLKKNN